MSTFLDLPPAERGELFRIGEDQLGRRAGLLEKDVWIVWTLDALFSCPDVPRMAFKGGTSLSKVYNAISRFSEDIDLTMDAHQLAPGVDVYPERPSSKERKRLQDLLGEMLLEILGDVVVPHLRGVAAELLHDDVTVSGVEGSDVIWVRYNSVSRDEPEYLKEGVKLEFGGRNAIEPGEMHRIETYLQPVSEELMLPVAESVHVLAAERTFWEKVTLAHSESRRAEFRATDRTSRHWYDLAMLIDSGVGDRSLEQWDVLEDVVRVKNIHYYTAVSAYENCLHGQARLVPDGNGLDALKRDYEQMIGAAMLDVVVDFDDVIDRVTTFEAALNARGKNR